MVAEFLAFTTAAANWFGEVWLQLPNDLDMLGNLGPRGIERSPIHSPAMLLRIGCRSFPQSSLGCSKLCPRGGGIVELSIAGIAGPIFGAIRQ